MYERTGQGTKLTIRKTDKGFLIEHFTCWSGSNSGFKALYRYSEVWPKNTKLSGKHNDYYDNGEILYEAVKTCEKSNDYIKILSRGHKVF